MHDVRQPGFILSDCLWQWIVFRSLIAVHSFIRSVFEIEVGSVVKTRTLTLGAETSRTVPGGLKWLEVLRASAH